MVRLDVVKAKALYYKNKVCLRRLGSSLSSISLRLKPSATKTKFDFIRLKPYATKTKSAYAD